MDQIGLFSWGFTVFLVLGSIFSEFLNFHAFSYADYRYKTNVLADPRSEPEIYYLNIKKLIGEQIPVRTPPGSGAMPNTYKKLIGGAHSCPEPKCNQFIVKSLFGEQIPVRTPLTQEGCRAKKKNEKIKKIKKIVSFSIHFAKTIEN